MIPRELKALVDPCCMENHERFPELLREDKQLDETCCRMIVQEESRAESSTVADAADEPVENEAEVSE